MHTSDVSKNNMNPRTLGAICLGLGTGQAGFYGFLNLTTGKVISKRQYRTLPIPDDVVQQVEELGEREGKPIIINDVPLFEQDTSGKPFDDSDNKSDQDSEDHIANDIENATGAEVIQDVTLNEDQETRDPDEQIHEQPEEVSNAEVELQHGVKGATISDDEDEGVDRNVTETNKTIVSEIVSSETDHSSTVEEMDDDMSSDTKVHDEHETTTKVESNEGSEGDEAEEEISHEEEAG